MSRPALRITRHDAEDGTASFDFEVWNPWTAAYEPQPDLPGALRQVDALLDRVRQAQAARARDLKATVDNFDREIDSVSETVAAHADATQVHECLDTLTTLLRQSITLAYFGGHTQREVGEILDAPLPTIKTRVRDGLIRLRDCMGVPA